MKHWSDLTQIFYNNYRKFIIRLISLWFDLVSAIDPSFCWSLDHKNENEHVPRDLLKDIVEYMSSKFTLLGPWECDSLAYTYK